METTKTKVSAAIEWRDAVELAYMLESVIHGFTLAPGESLQQQEIPTFSPKKFILLQAALGVYAARYGLVIRLEEAKDTLTPLFDANARTFAALEHATPVQHNPLH